MLYSEEPRPVLQPPGRKKLQQRDPPPQARAFSPCPAADCAGEPGFSRCHRCHSWRTMGLSTRACTQAGGDFSGMRPACYGGQSTCSYHTRNLQYDKQSHGTGPKSPSAHQSTNHYTFPVQGQGVFLDHLRDHVRASTSPILGWAVRDHTRILSWNNLACQDSLTLIAGASETLLVMLIRAKPDYLKRASSFRHNFEKLQNKHVVPRGTVTCMPCSPKNKHGSQ